MNNKQSLRTEILTKRKNLSSEQVINYSKIISEKINQLPEFKACRQVLGYMAIRNEVDIWPLLNNKSDRLLAMPRCLDKNGLMEFFQIDGEEDLFRGSFGIMEPKENCIMLFPSQGIIFVPGVAFDRNGYRMGYGVGYYDRYLSKYPELIRVGLAFDLQLCESTYNEEYDQKMDYIITEREILHYDRS